MLKSSEPLSAQPHYPVRLMVQDAFIILIPSILILICVLWVYRKDWSCVGLANLLATFLTCS